jgi:hypothetical protein
VACSGAGTKDGRQQRALGPRSRMVGGSTTVSRETEERKLLADLKNC